MDMRKIISKENEGRKRTRNQLLAGGVLIFIMFFSVLGYSFNGSESNDGSSTTKVVYNGFEFVEQNEFWLLKIGETNFAFLYNPEQINETIKIDSNLKLVEEYYGKPLYISSENYEAEAEIARNMGAVAQRIQRACLKGEKCGSKELPIKTCEDNFIMIKETNQPEIIQKENCVFIQGEEGNLAKIADEFLFKILKIE
ncbi:MAG: hypothetical protein KKA64_04865 [Nanoarchaeota archaeon]|nr:hypothetical protein [Nanoarchaeota archaeon]